VADDLKKGLMSRLTPCKSLGRCEMVMTNAVHGGQVGPAGVMGAVGVS
jgi:hypothetical protein